MLTVELTQDLTVSLIHCQIFIYKFDGQFDAEFTMSADGVFKRVLTLADSE